MRFWIFSLSFFFLFTSFALEVDEKLTIRFLKFSRSKKTVLINRGFEDGLAIGDHAKFFLTSGVISRGVVVKASPSRSIWSVYRVVDRNKMVADKVANLKITRPVKITDDSTREFKEDPSQQGAPSAKKDTPPLSLEDQREWELVGDLDQYEKVASQKGTKLWEVYGLGNMNVLKSQIDWEGEGNFQGNSHYEDWTVGMEKYFNLRKSFLNSLSFKLLFRWGLLKAQAILGSYSSNAFVEYGVGGSWHFSDPFKFESLVGFVDLNMGLGAVQDESGNLNSEDFEEWEGGSNFSSFGLGFKYLTRWGGSGRALLSHYRRNESYHLPNLTNTKTSQGFLLQLGLGYRF